jgi:hypothetical protein
MGRRLPRSRPWLTLGLAVLLSACANPSLPHGTAPVGGSTTVSPPPASESDSFYLVVADIDGPPASVMVNGAVAGHVACPNSLVLRRGAALPELPWDVVLETDAGVRLGSWEETGDAGPRLLTMRGTTVVEEAAGGPVGPPPASPCSG